MTLNAALSIAQSGLSYVQRALAQTSQNVANAGTAGYTRKTVAATALAAGDLGAGVKAGAVTRDVDAALQTQLDAESADVAAATAREDLLTNVEAAHGTTDGNNSLGSLTAALQNSFTALSSDPADQGQQSAVVQAAQTLVDRIHTISGAITDARQQAQDSIVSEVATVNTGLNAIARLTTQIQSAIASGGSAADLEDQRDQAISTLSESIPVRAVHSSNGSVTLLTQNGLSLPLRETGDALATSDAQVGDTAYYGNGGTLPGVTLDGVDVTSSLSGGRLSEYISLRDTTLPQFASEVDVAAANIAGRFDQEGLTLFGAVGSDGSVTVPDLDASYTSGGTAGFASTIAVNPAVVAKPSLVRDGTHATTGATAGFTPNTSDGPSGFTDLIDRVLNYTFGSQAADGVSWSPIATTGLGATGTLSSSFSASSTLTGYTAQLTATQTAARAAATEAKTSATTVQSDLQSRVDARSGVDTDTEMAMMVQLQNAYAANAKVMTTVQAMWDSLLAAVN